MSNISLGAQMRQNQEKATADAAAKERARVEKEQAEARDELAAVENFFDHAKRKFISDIGAGKPSSEVELGRDNKFSDAVQALQEFSWNDSSKRVDNNTKHKYHERWKEFQKWAHDNDLEAVWEYTHDGMSQSWHVLTVKPLY